ncbi:MAG TPA: tautomerase [Anaeromyxobacteraceae bacterium]|nr:tautomerase [Anaeromyxobacteraceae bacterium]
MPHIVFDLNLSPPDRAKVQFAANVARRFGEIMDTGTDHVAVLIRPHGAADLHLGLASEPARGVAMVNIDIRQGRTRDQERRLCLALIEELGACFGIPPGQVYVVITRHDGPEFQLSDRVLPSWSPGEDPLAAP